jgi:hypothetical protein
VTPAQRLRLLAFGVLTWSAGMFTAAETTEAVLAATAPAMAGIGAGVFVTALLPGRMARFL